MLYKPAAGVGTFLQAAFFYSAFKKFGCDKEIAWRGLETLKL